jgi:hypothetical protein
MRHRKEVLEKWSFSGLGDGEEVMKEVLGVVCIWHPGSILPDNFPPPTPSPI